MNPWLLLIQQNLSQPRAGVLELSPAPGLCKELFNIHGALEILALIPPVVTLHCHTGFPRGAEVGGGFVFLPQHGEIVEAASREHPCLALG